MSGWKKMFYGGIVDPNFYNYHTRELIDVAVNDVPLKVTCFGRGDHQHNTSPTNRPEGRKDYQLLYVKSGNIELTLEGKKIIKPKNTLILFKPGMPQIYTAPKDESCITYYLHFTGSDVEKILKQYPIPAGVLEFKDKFYAFEEALNRMYSEKRNFYWQDFCNTVLVELLIIISSTVTPTSKGSRMHMLLEYMYETCTENYPIKAYADYVNFSEVYFVRFFKKAMRTTPHQYIIDLRLDKSCSLLIYSNDEVNEIARAVGYTNPHYYSKAFKEKYGVTPSEYRAKNTKKKTRLKKQQ